MGDSYPFDWITTLDNAEKLDFDQVIGGPSCTAKKSSSCGSNISGLLDENRAGLSRAARISMTPRSNSRRC